MSPSFDSISNNTSIGKESSVAKSVILDLCFIKQGIVYVRYAKTERKGDY